jgi:hypothetical protein
MATARRPLAEQFKVCTRDWLESARRNAMYGDVKEMVRENASCNMVLVGVDFTESLSFSLLG